MQHSPIKILDCKIDIISKQELLNKIKQLLLEESNQQKQLVTTNPEFILAAQKDDEFRKIINNAWISVADGYGIRLAAKYVDTVVKTRHGCVSIVKNFFIGLKVAWWGITRNNKKLDVVREVITGTDLVSEICKLTRNQKSLIKVFLLGGFNDVPRLAADKLISFCYPNVERVGVERNREDCAENVKYKNLQIYYSIFEVENVIELINQTKSDILFVALGAPRQEKWIAHNLHKMPSVKLAIGVGGAFDYISGKIKRAPTEMRYSFEWLYRLKKQPRRIKRIWNAAVKFPREVFIGLKK